MDREGIYTARSAREIGADGEGKAGGSNAEKPPRSPESLLDVQPDNGNFDHLPVRTASTSSRITALSDRPARIRLFGNGNFTSLLTSLIRFST